MLNNKWFSNKWIINDHICEYTTTKHIKVYNGRS